MARTATVVTEETLDATITPFPTGGRFLPMTTIDPTVRGAHIVTVTPEIAAAWLGLNTNNREIKSENITKITGDMVDGAFFFTGAAIQFSDKGCLLDGQHRLISVRDTKMSFDMVVVTGVQTEAQAAMDSGKPRKLYENLGLLRDISRNQCVNLAAAITITHAWAQGDRTHDGSQGFSTSMGLAWFDSHPELEQISIEATKIAAKVPLLSAKMVALFIWEFDKLDVNDRKDFFQKLVNGAGLEEGNPILVLRSLLHKVANSDVTLAPAHRIALTIKAWNAYREGVKVKRLSFRAGGSKPEAFPLPI